MTVTTEHSLTTAVAPGGTDTFLFDFQTLDVGDIAAYANGILDAGASVTLNANQAVSPGGSVQYSAVQAIGTAISIERDMDLQQLTAYPDGGAFPSDSHETALDKLTMICQQAVTLAEGLFSGTGLVTISTNQAISGDKTINGVININSIWQIGGGQVLATALNLNSTVDISWIGVGVGGNPPFLNGWANFGAPSSTLAYYKRGDRVYLKGTVSGGTTGAGNPIFTLPAGFIPSEDYNFPTLDGIGTTGRMTIVAASGNVELRAGSNAFVVLDGFSFKV